MVVGRQARDWPCVPYLYCDHTCMYVPYRMLCNVLCHCTHKARTFIISLSQALATVHVPGWHALDDACWQVNCTQIARGVCTTERFTRPARCVCYKPVHIRTFDHAKKTVHSIPVGTCNRTWFSVHYVSLYISTHDCTPFIPMNTQLGHVWVHALKE